MGFTRRVRPEPTILIYVSALGIKGEQHTFYTKPKPFRSKNGVAAAQSHGGIPTSSSTVSLRRRTTVSLSLATPASTTPPSPDPEIGKSHTYTLDQNGSLSVSCSLSLVIFFVVFFLSFEGLW